MKKIFKYSSIIYWVKDAQPPFSREAQIGLNNLYVETKYLMKGKKGMAVRGRSGPPSSHQLSIEHIATLCSNETC